MAGMLSVMEPLAAVKHNATHNRLIYAGSSRFFSSIILLSSEYTQVSDCQ